MNAQLWLSHFSNSSSSTESTVVLFEKTENARENVMKNRSSLQLIALESIVWRRTDMHRPQSNLHRQQQSDN